MQAPAIRYPGRAKSLLHQAGNGAMPGNARQAMERFSQGGNFFPAVSLKISLGVIVALLLAGCEKPLKRKLMMAVEDNATVERDGIFYDRLENKKLTGFIKKRAENGRVTTLFSVKKGKREGVFMAWHENGRISLRGHFRDGREDGAWSTWYDNGVKRWEGHRRKGVNHGDWVMWNEGGHKKSEGTYENGLKEGDEVVWHLNGRVSQRRSYRKGLKDGRWTYWDRQGRLIIEELYRDDELIDSKKLPDFWLPDTGS